jgi:hypothetical protein
MSSLDDGPTVRVHHAVLFPREWGTGLEIMAPSLEEEISDGQCTITRDVPQHGPPQ